MAAGSSKSGRWRVRVGSVRARTRRVQASRTSMIPTCAPWWGGLWLVAGMLRPVVGHSDTSAAVKQYVNSEDVVPVRREIGLVPRILAR
jgi:hypothetical protein